MAIADEVQKLAHTPSIAVTLDGNSIDPPLSASVDLGYDTVTAACTLTYGSVPAGLDFRQAVTVAMGFNDVTEAVFGGFVIDDGRSYFPFDSNIKALGRLHRAQYAYPTAVSYASQTDTAIVEDLLDRAAVSPHSVQGEGTTFGAVQSVVLKRGDVPWDLINELDQVTGYATYDVSTQVRRRRVAGAPDAGSSVWLLQEGDDVLSIRRPRTIQNVHNKVIVTGLTIGGSDSVTSTWQGPSSYVPNPPEYITYNFRSQLIESGSYASNVASRLLSEQNRILDVIEVTVPGNPTIEPGDVVTLIAPTVNINSITAFYVRHVKHEWTSDSYTTKLTIEGGDLGTGGAEVTTPGETTADISYPESGQAGIFAAGGNAYATYVVAASDSVGNANYTCSGSNDDVTIQAAIDACTVGGRVLLLEGTYNVTGSITLADNITLEGQGWATKLVAPTSAAGFDMIVLTGASGVAVKNLYMLGNQSSVASDAMDAIYYGTGAQEGFLIEGVKVEDARYGIYTHFTGPAGGTIANCLFKDCNTNAGSWYGLYCNGTNVAVTGCVFDNSRVSFNSNQGTMTGCTFYNYTTTATASAGILISGNYATMTGCGVDNYSYYAISLAGTSAIVSNNHISNCGGVAIELNGSDGMNVVGNTIYNCGTGIVIASGTDHAIVANNNLKTITGGEGISVNTAAAECTIKGNSLFDIQGSNGIGLGGDECNVDGNFLEDISETGIYIDGTVALPADNNRVANNIIVSANQGNNGNAGIDVNDATNNYIFGNLLYDKAGYTYDMANGVAITAGATGTAIAGNDFRGCTNAAISDSGTGTLTTFNGTGSNF